MKLPRVFVLEPVKSSIDVSKAERYGEVAYVFNPDERRPSVFQATAFGESVLRRLEAAEFRWEHDYLAVAGSIVPVTIALMACMTKYPRLNVLFWHAGEMTYVRRQIDKASWKGDSHGSEGPGVVEEVAQDPR